MAYEKFKNIKIINSSDASSKQFFELRKNYDLVYPDTVSTYSFLSGSNVLYGRVDQQNNTVHANEFFLTEIKSKKSKNLLCLNFVADAFMAMRHYLKNRKGSKILPDQFFSTDWDVSRGWKSPHDFYDSKMDELYEIFVKGRLISSGEKNIKNIDDFIKVFFNDFYPTMDRKIPITKSGLIMSKYCSPSSTGMCLEIARKNFSQDSDKFNKFIKSPNFEFYLLTAAKFGFFVDKNAPWRLIANINSSAMQEYMSKYDLTTANVFEKAFVKTYKYDIQNLKTYLRQMYSSYLSLSPTYIEEVATYNNSICPPYEQINYVPVERKKTSTQEYNELYGNLFWLKIYFRIRLDDRHIKLSDNLLTKEIEKIEQLYFSLDFDQTLDYVNNRAKTIKIK
jgi:hypothetical protein